MKVVNCPNCVTEFKHDIALGRAVGVGVGLLSIKQGGAQGLVVGAVSYALGHFIDELLVEYVDPTCPVCGLVVTEAASIVAHNSR